MNEEEKEAIEYIKAFQKDLYGASEKNLMAIYIDRVWDYIDKLQKENEKINKVADKMYEYISYYGWEDFESNTGCNREEMVDYFYKE